MNKLCVSVCAIGNMVLVSARHCFLPASLLRQDWETGCTRRELLAEEILTCQQDAWRSSAACGVHSTAAPATQQCPPDPLIKTQSWYASQARRQWRSLPWAPLASPRCPVLASSWPHVAGSLLPHCGVLSCPPTLRSYTFFSSQLPLPPQPQGSAAAAFPSRAQKSISSPNPKSEKSSPWP